ncbi:hypothetical protein [Nonomuraea glycinis]|uniref:hypothetical protein n=1 Tax=Nonomuraea glycinis TaxID=2047744 RepID=UPI0033ABF354
MRRIWLTALAVMVAGCGIQPSEVIDAGQAPTGVASGATLYFVDADDRLRPQLRRTDHLGTIAEALAWLLTGPGEDLRTQITTTEGVTRVFVETTPDLIDLRLPLATYEVTPLGIDQIVCTALGVWVQSGGSRTTKVRLGFTLATPESAKLRTCPLIE